MKPRFALTVIEIEYRTFDDELQPVDYHLQVIPLWVNRECFHFDVTV